LKKVKVKASKVEELALSSIQSSAMLQMLDIWTGWAAGKPAPVWAEVKLMEILAPLIPMTACVDVIEGGKDFVYRYWGTGLTDLFGLDETGTRLTDNPIVSSQLVLSDQLQAVLKDGCPKFFVTTIAKDSGTYAIKSNLRLPIMDSPGEVTKILSLCEVERIGMEEYEDLKGYREQDT